MARIRILAEIGQDPALAASYRLNWGLQPNLAVDLLLTPLAGFIDAAGAGPVVYPAVHADAVRRHPGGLPRRQRQARFWPAALFLFLYNHVLIWGFLNFLFGLGLACSDSRPGSQPPTGRDGGARPVRGRRRRDVFRPSDGAWNIRIMVGAWEVGRIRDRWPDWKGLARDWALGAAQFLPAFALFVAALPPRVRDPEWVWGTPIVRLRGFLSPLLTNLSWEDFIRCCSSRACCWSVCRCAGCGRRAAWPCPFCRWRPSPWPHLSGPTDVSAGVWGLDVRLWVAFAFLAAAGLRFTGPGRGRDHRRRGRSPVRCRLYQVTGDWRIYDAQIAEYRAAAAIFKPGERILQAQDRSLPVAGEPGAFRDIYYHFTSFSVLDRGVFLPTLFTDPAKQPIVAAPELKEIDTPVGWPISRRVAGLGGSVRLRLVRRRYPGRRPAPLRLYVAGPFRLCRAGPRRGCRKTRSRNCWSRYRCILVHHFPGSARRLHGRLSTGLRKASGRRANWEIPAQDGSEKLMRGWQRNLHYFARNHG